MIWQFLFRYSNREALLITAWIWGISELTQMFDSFPVKLCGGLTLPTALTAWIFGEILSSIILSMDLVDLLSNIITWFSVGLLLLFGLGIVRNQILSDVLILVASFRLVSKLICTFGVDFSKSCTTTRWSVTSILENWSWTSPLFSSLTKTTLWTKLKFLWSTIVRSCILRVGGRTFLIVILR